MKLFLIILNLIGTFFLIDHSAIGQTSKFINPSGLYKYSEKTYLKGGEIYGYFGDVKVLLVDSNKIQMNFYVCKGAPSYNSGSFIETLDYSNNKAIYLGDTTMPELSCRLIFNFTSKGINIELFSVNSTWACGFGQSVDAQGFYKKIKGEIPTKQEILKEHE